MLRGALDHVVTERVGGWLFVEGAKVRGRTVLAFVDSKCVGAGKVEIYREDLAEAGVGDGYVGFDFPVSLDRDELVDKVVVKLEGSDAVLLQPTAVVSGSGAAGSGHEFVIEHSLGGVEWMRDRGWLEQTDFDFLKAVTTIGLYDRSLRKGRNEFLDAPEEALRLLELYCQRPVGITETRLRMGELEAKRPQLLKDAPIPIVAAVADSGSLRICEGSQNDAEGSRKDVGLSGAVSYKLGADRVLFFDLRAAIAGEGGGKVTLLAPKLL